MKTARSKYRYRIYSQFFDERHGLYCIYDYETRSMQKLELQQIFRNKDMLFQFSPKDICNIAFTAGADNILMEQKMLEAMREGTSQEVFH